MGILDFISPVTLGVEPGSERLRIVKDGSLIFDEPCTISLEKTTGKVTGFGNSIQSGPGNEVIKPVLYAIGNFTAYEQLQRSALRKGLNSGFFLSKSLKMYMSIPTYANEVEKRGYKDAAVHSGAVEVYMIHRACCIAIGMNLLFEKKNFILIDFTESKIEVSIFVDGGILTGGVFMYGTTKIVSLLKNHLKRNYNTDVNEQEIMEMLNNFHRYEVQGEVQFKHVTMSIKEIQGLIDHFFSLANNDIFNIFEQASQHPASEKAFANGVYFAGEGSEIEYLRKQININEKLPQYVNQYSSLDGVNGLKKVIANPKKMYSAYLMI